MFAKETYISRRKQLIRDVDKGLILLTGNGESPMNYTDNTFRFRQDSTFLYFTGISHPDLAILLDAETGKETLYGEDYTPLMILWMGSQPTIKNRAESTGIKNAAGMKQLANDLKKAQNSGRTIHFLPPYRNETRIKLLEWLDISPGEAGTKASLKLIKAVIKQRNYKSEEEIVEIEKAVNTSVDMHLAAMRMTRPGMTEAEIAAEVERIALATDRTISFPVIATINGQTLHNHYHGNRQKEIYQVALDAHEKAIAMLKPSIPLKEIYFESARTMMEGMKMLGFVKGDVNEAVEKGAHAMFFPCGLGHMMGLDVHDMEDLGEQYVGYDNEAKSTEFGLKSLRLGRKLEPGFVLTIEPGIYFIPQLIDLWKSEKRFEAFLNYDKIEEYRDFGGLRNEEDFLITETGARLLGKPLAKTFEEVENERAGTW